MAHRKLECIPHLTNLGIDYNDALTLRKIAMTLHRWFELECGDSDSYASRIIERDDATNKPYWVVRPHSNNKAHRTLIADREEGAKRRLNALMKRYPELLAFIQGDPRGAALYIVRKTDIPAGGNVDAYYNRGVAVYR